MRCDRPLLAVFAGCALCCTQSSRSRCQALPTSTQELHAAPKHADKLLKTYLSNEELVRLHCLPSIALAGGSVISCQGLLGHHAAPLLAVS